MSSEAMNEKRNPYQQWLERIQLVMKDQDASGWITVRCTDEMDLYDDTYNSDDEMSGSESSSSSTTYTQKEVDWIRCIILPPDRERAIEEMTELILGDQYDGHSLPMFNPSSFASNVLSAFEVMETNFKNKRLWSKKLNILLGFTVVLQQYDSWMDGLYNSDRRRLDGMITEIFTMWSRVMKKSSVDLGIDDEFTRPGIEYFLIKFKDSVGIAE